MKMGLIFFFFFLNLRIQNHTIQDLKAQLLCESSCLKKTNAAACKNWSGDPEMGTCRDGNMLLVASEWPG